MEYLYLGSINDFITDPSCYNNLGESAPSEADIEMIRSIKTGADIKTMTVGDIWKDDHESCVNMTINGAKFSAMWIVPEFLADVIYAGKGSEEARTEVASYINDIVSEQE